MTQLRRVLFNQIQNAIQNAKASQGNTPSGNSVAEGTIPVTPLRQEKMACGTTSMTMIFNAFGMNVTPQQLDATYRPSPNLGTPTKNMTQAGQDYGLYTSALNESDFSTIQQEIDNGNVMAALGTMPSGAGHWIVINGYRVDENGNQEILVTDPNKGTSVYHDYDEFDDTFWAERRNKITGKAKSDNLLITYSDDNDVPPSNFDPSQADSSPFQQALARTLKKLRA